MATATDTRKRRVRRVKRFTLPEDVLEFLEREGNQSATIEMALRQHYDLPTEDVRKLLERAAGRYGFDVDDLSKPDTSPAARACMWLCDNGWAVVQAFSVTGRRWCAEKGGVQYVSGFKCSHYLDDSDLIEIAKNDGWTE